MAKSRKKAKRVRRVQAKKKKTNYSLYVAFVIIAFVLIAVYIFSSLGNLQPYAGNTNGNQPAITQPETRSTGGFCKTRFECFITSCKGQAQDCINATQMATYANDKCGTSSDWNEGVTQNSSRCTCIQNACAMLK